ncbi:LCP family protein [Corynebacterium glucuronolyticum]|uniref:LCP family protein n=1 Tax=Corynebacterium glucuronolyticum TaxID=39791 RepID=UPI00223C448D|nr:LCP family protein [Corynebacterium glucuronolyticum]MCT1443050.1 LCP family protein [Corynebacterium glucuronolyticum]MCT1564153.1 LCP family protein [Corynebacterium glucuronolyticum]
MSDYATDRNGNVIRDRYGRPVPKRTRTPLQEARGNDNHSGLAERVQRRNNPPVNNRVERVPNASREIPSRRDSRIPNRAQRIAPQDNRRTRRTRSGCAKPLAIFLIVLLVALVGGGVWADGALTRIDAFPSRHIADTAGTNWLLVGSDSREGLTQKQKDELMTGDDEGGSRTDTIMVLHLPMSGKPTLLSIPRDSYVPIPGYGNNKINASFAIGGSQLLTETVEQNTGLKIDHYAEVGFGGLANIVDAVGGVELCTEDPIYDDVIAFYLEPGCHKFDGPNALKFTRSRATALGDIDRVARQRQFLGVLLDTMTSPKTLANPLKIVPLVTHVAGSFTVDNGDHIWHLARVALAMRSGINEQTIPVASFADTEVGSVVLWDQDAATKLFNSLN